MNVLNVYVKVRVTCLKKQANKVKTKVVGWPIFVNFCVILVSCGELSHWHSYHIFFFIIKHFKLKHSTLFSERTREKQRIIGFRHIQFFEIKNFFFLIFQSEVGTDTKIVDTVFLIIKSQTSPGILKDKPYNAKGQYSIPRHQVVFFISFFTHLKIYPCVGYYW